ncbi:MAG: V-type ATP synthase subunit I [Fretibacterium sp.]|nr:V-type ATP synthase subunit I [Fretibacterium sp.]
MGVTKLKKAELYYHKSVQEKVAEILQASGVCQLIESSGQEAPPSELEERLATSEEQLSHVRYLTRTLAGYYVDPVSSLDRVLGEKPIVSLSELEALAKQTDLSQAVDKVKERELSLNGLRMDMTQLRADEVTLLAMQAFPYPLSILTEGTQTVAGVSGTVKSDQLDSFKETLEPYDRDIELVVSQDFPKASTAQVAILYSRVIGPELLELLPRSGMTLMELSPSFKRTAKEELARVLSVQKETLTKEEQIADELRAIADEWMPTVQKLSDYWISLSNRYRAFCASDETGRTLRTLFWVPEESVASLQKEIEAVAPTTALFLSDPGPDDSPPSRLENGELIRPFNILTNLYSSPAYGQTDPTPLLAPFFFVFFGMSLGDAGYALVVGGAIALLFRKYRKIPAAVKDFILLFAFCTVSTLIYGIISGSFFGDFIDVFLKPLAPIKNLFVLVDPMKDPMQVLGISLLLGIIHLMFGLLIAAYDNIRTQNYLDALGDNISWFLLIVGLCLFGASVGGMVSEDVGLTGKIMSVIGTLLVFWYAGREKKGILSKIFSGLLALYGVTGYLGDILSYSRLLALGFGSAVIGMIINLLGGMSASIPYVGWLVAVIVIAGGHLFSILVNILGAFVHPLRLQYVEFFGKFYSGGGTPYTPLSLSREYVNIAQPAGEA